jgi:Flp pilus assembly protein TadG
MRSSSRADDGAAAVEFALVVPLLVLILAGVVDFGYRYQQHIQYTNAAIQGARTMSLGSTQGEATTAARDSAGNSGAQVSFSPVSCTAGSPITVTISATKDTLTSLFGSTFTVSGKAEVQCE